MHGTVVVWPPDTNPSAHCFNYSAEQNQPLRPVLITPANYRFFDSFYAFYRAVVTRRHDLWRAKKEKKGFSRVIKMSMLKLQIMRPPHDVCTHLKLFWAASCELQNSDEWVSEWNKLCEGIGSYGTYKCEQKMLWQFQNFTKSVWGTIKKMKLSL